ncbi:MAG: DUF4974 domain-containing protein [Pedobacter sp.]|uniref:FecR family protein n=1 Tax=Pedobacter sp. TaxID=1411316 RepID=UPI002809776E|nr:FecR domain-containing protein [Pedobacter sp.]MDQ8003171.1 DUF4974 domain-containing protein [Pedobacter sp.]
MHQTDRIIELLGKYLDESLNDQQLLELQQWANADPQNQQLIERLNQNNLLIKDIRLYWELWNDDEATNREQRILDKVAQRTKQPSIVPLYYRVRKWLPYAAALLVIATTTLFLINRESQKNTDKEDVVNAADILPGGNKATLTLADGRTIDLNSKQSGIVVGKDITYLDGSSIVNDKNAASETLVLKTPIGGNYKVVLPDGSQVWLNADSKLTYPSRFASNERIVKLEGEAYFEIKHQLISGNKIPFKVLSNGQTVNVLGTEFNVSAYAEEFQLKTTLVTGSVEIVNLSSKNINKIAPGQQATLNGLETKISNVDVDKIVAWKYGQFSFDDKSFDQIMREMARWYNIKIEYEGGIPTDRFTGNAFKTDKLATVLRFLESSAIKYRIKTDQNNNYKVIINNTANGR